jgi:hypothetical protein
MRRATLLCALCFTGVTLPFLACSASHNTGSGFTPMTNEDSGAKGLKDAMTTGDVTHPSPTSSGDSGGFSMPDFDSGLPDGSVIVTSTIYAHTDTSLYSLDPTTQMVTAVGVFSGLASENDAGPPAVTDLAVNAAGQVYVNTETAIYTAALPSTPSATAAVPLTLVANIMGSASFYALAFTPADALGPGTGEVLIGGDGNGELWAINATSGATTDLGNFGSDPSRSGNFFGLSGDIVFYTNGTGAQTGLATIRSCAPPTKAGYSPECVRQDDYLAGIDMMALSTAYTTQTKASSLLGGIYGGSSTSPGNGTGYGDLFGLGAWNGSVFAFSRNINADTSDNPPVTAVAPTLLTIDTMTGVGTPVPNGTQMFTDGWSGAGVTTKVTINIPPPPPPPS